MKLYQTIVIFVVQVHLDDCLRGLVKTYLTKLDPENMLELSSQSMVKKPHLPKSHCCQIFQLLEYIICVCNVVFGKKNMNMIQTFNQFDTKTRHYVIIWLYKGLFRCATSAGTYGECSSLRNLKGGRVWCPRRGSGCPSGHQIISLVCQPLIRPKKYCTCST